LRIPPIRSEYFPLKGGLDLVAPSISIDPGKCFDAQNYEPETSGGYRRIDGNERYDGRTSPSAASYWVMDCSITGTISDGETITGVTSGATGKVLSVAGSTLVLGRVTGTFLQDEALQVSAVTVATCLLPAYINGSPDPENDAAYTLLAANDYRADIQAVPGSGPIRGVFLYQDVVYAFRDNAGGTAGNLYKSSSSGWQLVSFGTEIQFTAGTANIAAGDLITGGTSGATASVVAVLLRTGTWAGTAVGTLIISPLSGTWQNGEAIKVGGTSKATSASLATAITRAPGGRVEAIQANFTGSTQTSRMYGADGVNYAFEFDGVNYIPIRTGMTADTPLHIALFKSCLFLSFHGSLQISAIGTPYSWTAVLGAAELTTGEEITGLMVQSGTSNGAALTVSTAGQTYTLYGNSTADFKLVPSVWELGYLPYTLQQVSNNTYGLTARGIQSLMTTQSYGDFSYASVSHAVQPYIESRRGTQIASVTNKTRSQYRLFFSDGSALVVGLTGDSINGCLPLLYPNPVTCIYSGSRANGQEVTFFGSSNGYIYQDNIGTSFDGAPIESWIRPVFNNSKSPLVRKRYRRAIFEVKAEGFSKVDVGYDIGYGTPDVLAPVGVSSNQISGGGFWDQFSWDSFTWDYQTVSDVNISLDGTERNVSFLVYSNRAGDKPHTIQGINLLYTPRRLTR